MHTAKVTDSHRISDENEARIGGIVTTPPRFRVERGTSTLTVRVRSRRALPGTKKRWRHTGFQVEVFGREASRLKKELRKGDIVLACGHFESRQAQADSKTARSKARGFGIRQRLVLVAERIDVVRPAQQPEAAAAECPAEQESEESTRTGMELVRAAPDAQAASPV